MRLSPSRSSPCGSSLETRLIDSMDRFGSVEGLLFDMGDVLYDATVWRRWLVKLLAHMGLDVNYSNFFRVWDRDYLGEVHCGRREYGEAFHAFLTSAGLSRGQVDEVEAASNARKRELEQETRPLPGVRRTIERLTAAGIALGVVSDSESTGRQLQERLARLGMVDCFGVVVSSRDLARTKPDPACYRAGLEGMKLPIERVAFVGHDCEELDGARAIGLRTVAFNFDAGAVADHYLERFEELLWFAKRGPAAAKTLPEAA